MQKIVALDTEFERIRTYRPILSIVQICFENEEPRIFDVLNGDADEMNELKQILTDDKIVKIIHSARQDVEAVYYHFGIAMKNIFDTQIAVKCLTGENEIGYANLVKNYCHIEIVKEKRLQHSNWMRRPLSEEQIFYAKQDVRYLCQVYYILSKLLEQSENKNRFINECELLADKDNYAFNPLHFWQKIKHKFHYTSNYNLIRDLFILREKVAYKVNLPREFVIKTSNLFNFAETGDFSFLKTHKKVNRGIFIDLYNREK